MNQQENKRPQVDRPSPIVAAIGIATVITALCNFGGLIPWPIHQLCIAAGFLYGAVDARDPRGKAAFALGAVAFVAFFVLALMGVE